MGFWGVLVRSAAAVGAAGMMGAAAAAAPGTPAPAPQPPPPAGAVAELFSAPVRKDLKVPYYPRSRREEGIEGWVQLHFMIDGQGRPYEIAVTDSTGDEAFEEAAVRAVERSTFEPAMLAGEPVDAGYNLKISFALEGEGSQGARPGFVRDYRRTVAAIEAGRRAEAENRLDNLSVRNLYEDAYLNLARYEYQSRWGTPDGQLRALERAVAHEQEQKYLPADVFRWALLTRFALEMKLQDFGGALRTATVLRRQALTAQQIEALERTVADIHALQRDDRSFAVSGRIDEGGSWFLQLLKRSFYLDQVMGQVAELKLRCERDYVLFRYDPQMQYRIPPQQGECHLEVVGEPGTRFRLVQS